MLRFTRGDCEGDRAGAKKKKQVQQCRGTEQMQSRFRSAEVHWCGGVEMQNAEVQKCKHSHVLVDP